MLFTLVEIIKDLTRTIIFHISPIPPSQFEVSYMAKYISLGRVCQYFLKPLPVPHRKRRKRIIGTELKFSTPPLISRPCLENRPDRFRPFDWIRYLFYGADQRFDQDDADTVVGIALLVVGPGKEIYVCKRARQVRQRDEFIY